jgi:2-oxoisovalerate dehydrogenase E2 component (dihydrolipoyl transacylase)
MTDFILPDLGEGLPDAEVVKWLVKEGDFITEGDDMVEMSTAKAVVEVPSPYTGRVVKLHGGIGDVINTGNALVSFEVEGETVVITDNTPGTGSIVKDTSGEETHSEDGTETFILPDLGEGLQDAEIVTWSVKVGDKIEADDLMVEMSTAKAVVEVPSPFTGIVVRLYGGPGDVINTGDPLIKIITSGGAVKIKSAPKADEKPVDSGTVVGAVQVGNEVKSESTTSTDGVKAGAAVRALARKAKIDLKSLQGTGNDGEITFGDVRAAESGVISPSDVSNKPTSTIPKGDVRVGPSAKSLADELGIDLSDVTPSGPKGTVTKKDVLALVKASMSGAPASKMQSHAMGGDASITAGKAIMAAPKVRAYARDKGLDISKVEASGHEGSVTIEDVNNALKADFTVETVPSGIYNKPARAYEPSGNPERLVGPRRVMAQGMAKANAEVCHTSIFDETNIASWPKGTDITVRIMRSIVAACMVEPALNAIFNGETYEKTILKNINLGVAVDSPKGLFVPVLKEAENADPKALRAELDRLRAAISDGKITPKEMSGTTITLSNFGMIAGRFATPIVSVPQVAIVGIGGLFTKLVMTEKGIEDCRHIPVSLTFDHRAATGGEAARFLGAMLADLNLKF